MKEDKAALVRSLRIDRAAAPAGAAAGPVSRLPRVAALILLLGAGAGLAYAWQHGLGPFVPATAPDASTPSGSGRTAASPDQAAPDQAAQDRAVQAPAAEGPATQGPAAPGSVSQGSVAQARPSDLVASGYVVARRMATVSAESFGLVTAVLVEEGMAVQAGQVLATLDDRLARIDLDLARARVGTARAGRDAIAAELSDARRQLTRIQRLTRSDAASEASLTATEARVAVLAANLARAEAELEQARLTVARSEASLDKLTIRAPFAGVVVDKNAQPGEIISPNSAGGGFTRTGICTIVDMDSLEVEVDVNEAFIGRVRPGQPVRTVLDAYPDWAIPGRVAAVVPTANRDRATITVRIGLDVKDPRILRDMGAKVTFLDREA